MTAFKKFISKNFFTYQERKGGMSLVMLPKGAHLQKFKKSLDRICKEQRYYK